MRTWNSHIIITFAYKNKTVVFEIVCGVNFDIASGVLP